MTMIRLFVLFVTISMVGCASQQKLMTSLAENDIETAKDMVEAGISPYQVNENGESAVSLGLKARKGSDIQQWAEKLAAASSKPARALWDRAQSGSISVDQFRAELEKAEFYIDASLNGEKGWTMLIDAVFDGSVDLARTLINAGANLEAKSDNGWTALHYTANTAENGHRDNDAELARLLINAGADLNAQTNVEYTPLYLAVSNERSDVLDVLIGAGANLDLPDDHGWTPLVQTVFDGKVDLARALINAGANLEAKQDTGWTALHFTANNAKNGHRDNDAELARLLINAGADLNAQDSAEASPLYLAVVFGRTEVLDVLIGAGANLDLPDGRGWTPLMQTVFGGKVDLARTLINAGANLGAKQDTGWTALHFTANNAKNGNRDNDAELARLLINAGADLNAQTSAEESPLYIAVRNDRSEVVDVLIGAGADLDLPEDDGWTPLMKAVFDGKVELARALINAGANLEAKSDKGWTALHFTANTAENGDRDNDAELARLLLKAGANTNSLNDELVTPLMLTALNDRRDVARELLNSGARTNVKNKFGRTALDEAKKEGHYRIAAMIREYSMASSASSAASQSPWPAKPAPRQGYTTCNTRCVNGDCFRTYSDGRKVRFQAERKFNPLTSQWEFDSGSC